MKLLAIDPGSRVMGWAFVDTDKGGIIETGVIVATGSTRPERLGSILHQLTRFIKDRLPDYVAYEEQFVRGGAATKALFGVVGVIEAVANIANAGVIAAPQSMTVKWLARELNTTDTKDRKALYKRYATEQLKIIRPEQDEYDAASILSFIVHNAKVD